LINVFIQILFYRLTSIIVFYSSDRSCSKGNDYVSTEQ